jgi:hypothetical protein
MSDARKKNDTQLLLALACGASVEQAARQSGLTARTVYRRLEDAAFRRRIQKVQHEIVERTTGTLTAAATEAVKTLLELLKNTSPPPVRLGAARSVLEMGLKLREIVELMERMAALEEQVNAANKEREAAAR